MDLCFLRKCVVCEVRGARSGLCSSCEKKIFSSKNQISIKPNLPFGVHALWNWNLKNDFWIKPLIYYQKAGGVPELSYRLAQELVVRRLLTSSDVGRLEPLVLVPAPSKRLGPNDHAADLAQGLSLYLGVSVWAGLSFVGEIKRQALLQRQERRELKFSCLQKPPGFRKGRIVFVDDVLTTGSTARAAWEAMGRPKKFETWVIAHRELWTLERGSATTQHA